MWGAVGYFDVDDKHLQAMDDYTFLAAVEENDQALVRSMLKRDATMMMTSARSDLMETPLQIAAREGHLSMVKLLVAYGADVQDEGGEEYVTALHEAAARGHTEVVKFLLHKGAKPCTADLRNETPLLQAARGGHVEVVKLLLPHMSRQALDVQDRKGATALWHACQVGAADVVRVLLLAGADRSIASMEQGTPRQVAVQEGREAVLALLDWWEGQVERAYLLARGRAIVTSDHTTGHVPAYLTARAGAGLHAPQLVLVNAEEDGTAEHTEASATLAHLLHDLPHELFTELMDGMRHE